MRISLVPAQIKIMSGDGHKIDDKAARGDFFLGKNTPRSGLVHRPRQRELGHGTLTVVLQRLSRPSGAREGLVDPDSRALSPRPLGGRSRAWTSLAPRSSLRKGMFASAAWVLSQGARGSRCTCPPASAPRRVPTSPRDLHRRFQRKSTTRRSEFCAPNEYRQDRGRRRCRGRAISLELAASGGRLRGATDAESPPRRSTRSALKPYAPLPRGIDTAVMREAAGVHATRRRWHHTRATRGWV